MDELLLVIVRTLVIVLILFILEKLMGKKQISQLNLFDYIIGITIGNIAAEVSLNVEKNYLSGILCMLLYGFCSILVSIVTMKSMRLRRLLVGVPTVLIENKKIIEEGLKKTKIDINDLLTEAREQGYFKLEDIEYAIMETTGRISFMPVNSSLPLTKKDMNIKFEKQSLVANIIIDEILLEKNLFQMGKDINWLNKQLKIKGYSNYKNILLATLDINDKIVVYEKNIQTKKHSVLE